MFGWNDLNKELTSPLYGKLLKLADNFLYSGRIISTDCDVNMCIGKARTVLDRLSIIWKSDLPDKIKLAFFQAVAVSVLLYESTIWNNNMHGEKLDGNYIRMPRAVLNKSWKQHPTKPQLYGHLLEWIVRWEVRRTRYVGFCRRSKDKPGSNFSPMVAKVLTKQ